MTEFRFLYSKFIAVLQLLRLGEVLESMKTEEKPYASPGQNPPLNIYLFAHRLGASMYHEIKNIFAYYSTHYRTSWI